MKSLVTGGSGFIGHNLCLRLKQMDWECVVVDDYSSGHQNNRVPGYIYHQNSILNNEFIDDLVSASKFDVVFHLAAIPRVPYSTEYPVKTTHANVIGAMNLLDAIRRYSPSTRFIFSGSSSVYGGADTLPTTEEYPLDPQSPYAMQKMHGEMWCRMYSQLYGISTAVLRYFNVFGAHSRFGGPYTTVLGAWLYSLYVDPAVRPYLEGDGTQTRDFCYIDNVVNANILAATNEVQFKGEVFNIAQGEQHSLIYCKDLLESISGKTLDLEHRPPRIGDVDHTLADIDNSRSVLGYDPAVDFDEQVRLMSEWYRNEYANEVSAAILQ